MVLFQVWCRLVKLPEARARARSSSIPARPYLCRLRVFNRLICPSVGPLLQTCSTALSACSAVPPPFGVKYVPWRRSPVAELDSAEASSHQPRLQAHLKSADLSIPADFTSQGQSNREDIFSIGFEQRSFVAAKSVVKVPCVRAGNDNRSHCTLN
jgi:hypothetical protein